MADKKQRKGRGRVSSIDLLPEDLKAGLNEALREKKLTQRQIVDHFNALLADRNLEKLSKSAVNRYAVYIEEQSAQLREAREVADAICGNIEQKAGGDVGRATSQIVKSLVFDLTLRQWKDAQEENKPLNIDLLGDLALTIQRLERAEKTSTDRELKIREKLQNEQRAKMEKAVEAGDFDKEVAEEAMRIMGFSV